MMPDRDKKIDEREYLAFAVVLPPHGAEIELMRYVKIKSGIMMETQIEIEKFGRRFQSEGWPYFRILRHANSAAKRKRPS